jgi:ABC-type transport system involved in multi-copper enzyme maturation permease subunit
MIEICIHQIKDNFKNLKFLLSFLLIFSMMVINALFFSFRIEKQIQEYNYQRTSYNERMRGACFNLNTVVFAEHLVFKKPFIPQFIISGKQNRFPDLIKVKIDQVSLPENILDKNKMILNLPPLDWFFIFSIIGPFLIFVITYDSISGEKEKGIFKLIFSNSLKKFEYILGKILGTSISLMLPILFSILINILIIILVGKFSIDILMALKIVAFIFYLIIYIIFFVSLGLFVSLITNNSLKSLIILSFLWVIFVIIIPVITMITISNIYKTPSIVQYNRMLKDTDESLALLLHKYDGAERGVEGGKIDNYKKEKGTALAWGELYEQKQKITNDFFQKKILQAQAYYRALCFSPVYLFQSTVENLFSTGLNRDINFYNRAQTYQEELISFYKEMDLKDDRSPHVHFYHGYLSNRSIDYKLVPSFIYDGNDTGDSLMNSFISLSIILTELLILAFLMNFIFQKRGII